MKAKPQNGKFTDIFKKNCLEKSIQRRREVVKIQKESPVPNLPKVTNAERL
jgi:hypothetical protein